MKLENLLKRLQEKQPITINYGKGCLSNNDIKDYATWNDKEQAYTDSTGIWDLKLLIEIAKGKVEGITIE